MKRGRNYWLDSLRGLAAIAVALHHFNSHTGYNGNWFNEVTEYGARGVEVFFFISGFCIQAASYRVRGAGQFLWQRLCRIYPPYLLSLLVTLASAVVRKVFVGVNDAIKPPHGLSEWLATFAITTYPATPVRVMNWVYWTLSYELMFYLILGAIMLSKNRHLPLYLITGLSFFEPMRNVPGLFFLDYWSIFCLGLSFYEYRYGHKRHGLALMLLSSLRMAVYFPTVIKVAVLFAFISVAISERWPGSYLCRKNILSKCGDWSYSIYLLHVPVAVFCLYGLQQALGMDRFPINLLYYLGLLVLTLCCSWISYNMVEKPAIRIGKSYDEMNAWLSGRGPFPNPYAK